MDGEWLKNQFLLQPEKSRAELARLLGIGPPAISKIIGGTRQIKVREYALMRQFFSLPSDGVSATMAKSSGKPLDNTLKGMRENKVNGNAGAWEIPPLLEDMSAWESPDRLKIFNIRDNAMAPDFRPGEQVLVNLSDTMPRSAGVFVIADEVDYIIRDCVLVVDEKGDPMGIALSARSKIYGQLTLPPDNTLIIGRVIAKLQKIQVIP